jgi:hypothetical protein
MDELFVNPIGLWNTVTIQAPPLKLAAFGMNTPSSLHGDRSSTQAWLPARANHCIQAAMSAIIPPVSNTSPILRHFCRHRSFQNAAIKATSNHAQILDKLKNSFTIFQTLLHGSSWSIQYSIFSEAATSAWILPDAFYVGATNWQWSLIFNFFKPTIQIVHKLLLTSATNFCHTTFL